MKRILRIILALAVVLIIGLVVWNDWLRDASVSPTVVPGEPPAPEREIVGIGAVLKTDDDSGAPQIVSVLPNSPASKAGLSAGLIIQKIDNTATAGLSLSECVERIRGPAGTKLKLELLDADQGTTNVAQLIRERVPLPPEM